MNPFGFAPNTLARQGGPWPSEFLWLRVVIRENTTNGGPRPSLRTASCLKVPKTWDNGDMATLADCSERFMKPIAILLTGHAPAPLRARLGDFDHWFRMAMGLPRERVQIINVDEGATLPALDTLAGAVISGSAAMVTEQLDWSEQLAAWIRTAVPAGLPLFGVCYGHQLMAHALGGTVGELAGGREMGTQTINLTAAGHADPLLAGFPDHFTAHTTHLQSVLEVPPGAQVLASSARDPYHILRYGPQAVSTQLHPEFSTTAMRAYVRLRHVKLMAEGIDTKAMLAGVTATPDAKRLLRRFANHANARQDPHAKASA